MPGLSVYLYSFDHDLDTYVWDKHIHAYVCEKTGRITKGPIVGRYNEKYVSEDPDKEDLE